MVSLDRVSKRRGSSESVVVFSTAAVHTSLVPLRKIVGGKESGRRKRLTKFELDVALEPDDIRGGLGVPDQTLKDELLVFPGLDPGSRGVVQYFHAARRYCIYIRETPE